MTEIIQKLLKECFPMRFSIFQATQDQVFKYIMMEPNGIGRIWDQEGQTFREMNMTIHVHNIYGFNRYNFIVQQIARDQAA